MSVFIVGSAYLRLVQQGRFSELSQELLANEEARDIDCHFAKLIVGLCAWPDVLTDVQQTDHDLMYLLAAKLSVELQAGHVCVPLAEVNDWFARFGMAATGPWHERLLQYAPFSRGEGTTPIVFELDCFYLQRYWRFEKSIADYVRKSVRQDSEELAIDRSSVCDNLTRLFGPLVNDEIDWQRVAACLALKQKFLLISGGPGTGKTTTVIKLLALLMEQLFHNPVTVPVIKMAAPTGKAAARLSESIRTAKNALAASPGVKKFIPEEALTLHRLLGYQAHSTEYRHNRNNPLLIDVLVVDEASMIDVAMMAKLLESLPSFTRLILLGDKDQLSSVEAGSVFADLNAFGGERTIKQQMGLSLDDTELDSMLNYDECDWYYSGSQSEWLIAHGAVHKKVLEKFDPAERADADCRANLVKSYRFGESSGIKRLADASNSGDVAAFIEVLQQGSDDFAWYDWESGIPQQSLEPHISEAVLAYSEYLQLMQSGAAAESVIKSFERFRVLCAANYGSYGVDGINERIEAGLVAAGLISIDSQFYIGRPIIIEVNNYDLKLFNGDIGLCMVDSQGVRHVAFLGANGDIRRYLPSRIPQHRTVYAMTVHKSQGSEFNHTALVLPQTYTALLSRELLYTAITRAKQRFSLFAGESLLRRMIASHTHRWSGLAKRLWSA